MRRTVLALTCAFFLLAGPAGAKLYPFVITDSGSITLSRDNEFLVVLPFNPSTGYAWEATVSNLQAVTAEGAASRSPDSPAIGATGERIFAFKAARIGTATITIAYHRPWEKNVRPARTITILVTVTK